MVWCKVRMWGDEENEEGRRRNRVTYRSRAQVSDMCMKNEMMRKKCWMKSVRSEMMREEESQCPFKVSRTKSRCCAKSPKCRSSGNPSMRIIL